MARLIFTRGGYTLRARLLVALFITGIAPQALVFAFSLLERPVFGRMLRATDAATSAAHDAAAGVNAHDDLVRVAIEHRVRVRLYSADDQLLQDVDHDEEPADPLRPLERFLVATATPAEVREAEHWRGPPEARQEFLVGKSRGVFIDCDMDAFVFCQGTRTVDVPTIGGNEARHERKFVVHVQKSSLRAVGPVYALRQRLLRLLVITVPLSFMFAYFLSRRLHKPLSALRDATLEKATAAHAVADLPEGPDEIGEVGHSVNLLLRALDERRKATSAFMADAVHEVKNPVAAIKAAAESLASGAQPPEKQQRIARIVQESAVKLDRLVTGLLDLSRAEAGMPGEERSAVDLRTLATAVSESVQHDVRFANVKIVVVPADGEDAPLVSGVSARLESVLRELVVNGASFCEEKGGEVNVALTATKTLVTVDVTDTGPGIDPQALPHVFDRFFTTRVQQKGTGLGLAMVKAVVEAHGGHVKATSSNDAGAHFSFTLPRAAENRV